MEGKVRRGGGAGRRARRGWRNGGLEPGRRRMGARRRWGRAGRKLERKHPGGIKAEGDPSGADAEENVNRSSAAEARAARYGAERDTLHRMLREEVAGSGELAEVVGAAGCETGRALGGWGDG